MLQKKKVDTHIGTIIFIAILIIGLIALRFLIIQSTDNQQHASQAEDLNMPVNLAETINSDNSMGPVSFTSDFSQTFPPVYLGSLNFKITDPTEGGDVSRITPTGMQNHDIHPTITEGGNHLEARPTITPVEGNNHEGKPTTTPGEGNGNNQNTPDITSLVIVVKKVEVHLAHVALPGQEDRQPTPESTLQEGKPSITPTEKTNQNTDKWETLDIGGEQSIDLMQLANSQTATSLGLTKLVGGTYTELRLYLSSAQATFTDGKTVDLTIPGAAFIVRVNRPFVIKSGNTTTVTMDFDAKRSIVVADGVYLLKPVVAHFTQEGPSSK